VPVVNDDTLENTKFGRAFDFDLDLDLDLLIPHPWCIQAHADTISNSHEERYTVKILLEFDIKNINFLELQTNVGLISSYVIN